MKEKQLSVPTELVGLFNETETRGYYKKFDNYGIFANANENFTESEKFALVDEALLLIGENFDPIRTPYDWEEEDEDGVLVRPSAEELLALLVEEYALHSSAFDTLEEAVAVYHMEDVVSYTKDGKVKDLQEAVNAFYEHEEVESVIGITPDTPTFGRVILMKNH